MGLKKLLKKAVKINKDVFSGKLVKNAVKTGVSAVKQNPELAAVALTAAGAPPGASGGLAGIFGTLFGGGAAPAPVYEPEPFDPGPAPALAAGFDNKTLLLAAGAVVAAVVLTRK